MEDTSKVQVTASVSGDSTNANVGATVTATATATAVPEQKKEEFVVPAKKEFQFDESDPLRERYGFTKFIQSQSDPNLRYHDRPISLRDISPEMIGKEVKIRARIHSSRIKGNLGFIVLRENFDTFQAMLSVSETVSKPMMKFANFIPLESIIEVTGVIQKGDVKSCTIKDYELVVNRIYVISMVIVDKLPFQIEDAQKKVDPSLEEEEEHQVPQGKPDATTDPNQKPLTEKELKALKKKEKAEAREKQQKEKEGEKKDIIVKMKTKLDNRVLDLRVNSTNALMRLQSGVCYFFREYLHKNGFVEIHTPKLIFGASEGGTNVFTFKYFNTPACLAQSPQLYKQMAVIGDIPRVFEIGSVFRAENANTPRHLCEFMGLDIEMAIQNHYYEVLDVVHGIFTSIFEGLNANYKQELEVIGNQYPFEPIKYTKEPFILDFETCCNWLEAEGFKPQRDENGIFMDFDTPTEKALGVLVKQKYDTDFYILKRYPKSARPFYTMPDPENDNYTNSYDAFLRGEEILSGAQRIHDPELLFRKVKDKGINPETLKDYIRAFELGAPPHGGAGIGLERVVKLFVGLQNVKKCSMFPRDPKRLTP